MASSSSSSWRTTRHRHTVPNSDYSSFPCYQEEINLKTNVECDHSNESPNATNKEEIQVNVSMHDKLKMCFAEMENMKNQFDNRRRKVQTKKRTNNMNWTTKTNNNEEDDDREEKRRENTAAYNKQQGDSKTSMDKEKIDRGHTSRATGGHKPNESTAHSTMITIDSNDNTQNRFRARLIRTLSKDSMEDPNGNNHFSFN